MRDNIVVISLKCDIITDVCYCSYSMSVIQGRAWPDLAEGAHPPGVSYLGGGDLETHTYSALLLQLLQSIILSLG